MKAIKRFVLKQREQFITARYRLAVGLGFGFEMQCRLFPDHLIRKRVIRIDTSLIQWAYHAGLTVPSRRLIVSGNWDTEHKVPLEQFLKTNDSCHSIFQIFSEGMHYRQCDQYKTIKSYIEQGVVGPGWQARGCYTVAEIDRYFHMLERTFQSMKASGYKTQMELKNPDPYDELEVVIDRTGAIQKQEGEGHHRLAMAILLNVPEIPVIIKRIHGDWARQLCILYNRDLLKSLQMAIDELDVDSSSQNPICGFKEAI